MYGYEWDGMGVILYDDSGRSCYIQGEEGSDLFDKIDQIEDDEMIQSLLSEYDHVMEKED